MPPPAEAQQLKAALGDGFPAFKEAKNSYRDGQSDAQSFLSAFYAIIAADDGLAARADSLLGLATALLPPAQRGALRDPTLRGRARAAAVAQQEALRSTLSVTLKSLQRPAVVLDLSRDVRVEELRAQCASGNGSVRLLVSGAALEDGRTLGDYSALALPGATIHMLAMRAPQPAPEPAPEPPSPAPAPAAPQAVEATQVEAAQADRRQRLQQQAEQEEADHLLAVALAEADAEELHAAELASELAAAEAEQESDEEDGRFSDDDETVIGSGEAGIGGTGTEPDAGEGIANLATEISTAQAQTAWSGCPEGKCTSNLHHNFQGRF